MKLLLQVFVAFAIVATCYGFSQPIIKNTKANGCIDDMCGAHCSYDGVKLFPGKIWFF